MGRAGAGDVHAGSLPRRELNVHPRALPAAIFCPALTAFTPWNIVRMQRYYESPALWKNADLVRDLVKSNFLYRLRGHQKSRQMAAGESLTLAGPTGLEPATSGVTGRRSNNTPVRHHVSADHHPTANDRGPERALPRFGARDR